MLTDTHAHFDSVSAVRMACVRQAIHAGVTRILAVGGSPELNEAAILAAREFPGTVRLALGLDRDQAGLLSSSESQPFASTEPPADISLAAIGEIGLDYHYHPETRASQCALFADMLQLAGRRDLPAIIHTREADEDTLRVLMEAGSSQRRAAGRLGVVHCFTGEMVVARKLLDLGLYLGFSGIVTFRNADMLREVARVIPEDRLLIETDSPFLAPVPKRGQRNESAFVIHVAECLARLRGISVERIAELTTRNAEDLFGPWPKA